VHQPEHAGRALVLPSGACRDAAAWQGASVVALPDFPRYRDLHAETAGSLAAANIEVWWVDQAGAVDRP